MGPKRVMRGGLHLKKCGRSVDMISKLADDVIVNILSFLPLNEAATTSLLSHRWLHLWKYTTKLNFKVPNVMPQKRIQLVNRVDSVIKSHKALSLKEFTIEIYAVESDRYHLAKWLEFAFSRRVERLELNWHCNYPLSPALALQEILKNITIPTTGMQSLKVLCLRETKTNGDDIKFFLRNCPLLEQLVIKYSIITSDLEIIGPSLKHLDISPRARHISIKISAPNLTSLKIEYDAKKVFLENVPKIVNMIFNCRDHSTMRAFGTAASQLETLTISMDHPKSSFLVPEMPKLKKLVVDDCYHNPYDGIAPFPVTSFLRASPCLEEFEVEITGLTLEDCVSEVPKVGHVFQHLSLKRFKLLWFCGRSPCDDRIKLVRYIVDNCVALEEIDISHCDGTKLGRAYSIVVDDCVHVATPEERLTFENTIQLQLPGHIKLRFVNHSHKCLFYPKSSDFLHSHKYLL